MFKLRACFNTSSLTIGMSHLRFHFCRKLWIHWGGWCEKTGS